jgi:hypothetical protein
MEGLDISDEAATMTQRDIEIYLPEGLATPDLDQDSHKREKQWKVIHPTDNSNPPGG